MELSEGNIWAIVLWGSFLVLYLAPLIYSLVETTALLILIRRGVLDDTYNLDDPEQCVLAYFFSFIPVANLILATIVIGDCCKRLESKSAIIELYKQDSENFNTVLYLSPVALLLVVFLFSCSSTPRCKFTEEDKPWCEVPRRLPEHKQ